MRTPPPNNTGKHWPKPIMATVISAVRADGRTAHVWSGRKKMVVYLACGHIVHRIVRVRILAGEKMRCRVCEGKAPDQIQLFPVTLELR
jgi:predicted SprT family Zn-dependent metalloprotease